MRILGLLIIIVLTLTVAHGKIVPLHQIQKLQVQSKKVSSTYGNENLAKNEDKRLDSSFGALDYGTVIDDFQRNTKQLLQKQHIKDKAKNIDQNKSNVLEDFTGAQGCGALAEDSRRKVRHLLQKKHLKNSLNNTKLDRSNAREDFTCTCPDAAEFSPCTCDCDGENYEGRLDCSGIPDVNELKTKFQATYFPVKRYGMFHSNSRNQVIDASTLEGSSLPADVFAGIAFKKILFTFGVFESVHPEAFISSTDTLEVLYLACSGHLVYYPELVQLPYLRKLDISNNAIEQIPVVPPQPSIETLYISFNRIKNIAPYAFKNLPMLQILDLGRNKLTSLEKNTMHFVSDTPILYVDSNNIDYIDDEAFSGEEMSQPGLLDLSSNNLNTLKESVFRTILEVISTLMLDGGGVDVNDNPLNCSTLSWLYDHEDLQDLRKYLFAPQCKTNK